MGYADHRASKTAKATPAPAKVAQAKPSTPKPEKCPSFMTLMKDEKVAMMCRPSWLNYFWSLFFGVWLLFGSIICSIVEGVEDITNQNAPQVQESGGAGFGMTLGLILIGLASIRRSSVYYIVTTKRVLTKSGIISQSITEVWLNDIRGVNTSCGIAQRFFGLGNVILATASAAIKISGIRSYRELASELNAYRNR